LSLSFSFAQTVLLFGRQALGILFNAFIAEAEENRNTEDFLSILEVDD
jgi:hypothetical protein